MALMTALCGPLVKIMLINVFHLDQYMHPQFYGIPYWIPLVYFVAVGNLGRKYLNRANLEYVDV